MNESCKGCATYKYGAVDYEGGEKTCHYHGYNDKGQCPCTECIVKVMCNVNCHAFAKFTDLTAIIKDKGRP